jgi:hypothetical protein
MKHGIYTAATEPISSAYFINLLHHSVCLRMYSPTIVRQTLCKNVTAATNTRNNNRRIVGLVVSYEVRFISKESGQTILPRTIR